MVINSLFHDTKNEIDSNKLDNEKNQSRVDRRRKAKSYFDGSGLLSEQNKLNKNIVEAATRSKWVSNSKEAKQVKNSYSVQNLGSMFFSNINKESSFAKKIDKSHWMENKRRNPVGFGSKALRIVPGKNSLGIVRSLSPLKKDMIAVEFVGPGKYNDEIGSINHKQSKMMEKKQLLSSKNKYVDHCYGFFNYLDINRKATIYKPKKYFEIQNSMFENRNKFKMAEVSKLSVDKESDGNLEE